MKQIGLSFVTELKEAGLLGLPFSWGADGAIEFARTPTTFDAEGTEVPGAFLMSQAERDAVLAVYAAHDPAAMSGLRGAAVAAINDAFERAAARLTVSYPPSERLTWPIQEGEALAWNANNATATPYVDQLAAARGIPRDMYLQRTVAKVALFRQASALMVGLRQKGEDAIGAAQDAVSMGAARDAAIAALDAL